LPVVAAPEVVAFVGVTLATIVVPSADTEVTDSVRWVPSEALVNVSVAPVSNPVPVIVTVFAPVPSYIGLGVTAVTVGVAVTVKALAVVLVPLLSVMVTGNVPAT
jgi:hypothetical protein